MSDERQQAFVPGNWYMYFVLGGFTFIGQYVCSLGYNKHRFQHVVHLANAGGLYLPDLCAGKWNNQVIVRGPFPKFWSGELLHYADYEGQKSWISDDEDQPTTRRTRR